MTTVDDIRERLGEVRPVGGRSDIVTAGLVRGIDLRNGRVTVHLTAPPMAAQLTSALVADIRRAVAALPDVTAVEVQTVPAGPEGTPFAEQGPLPGVRDILAVTSTKGGVGKSTVATNLAVALQRLGLRVGLMDADVYGPSLPLMLGVDGRPRVSDQERIEPLEQFGLKVMSVGFFLDDSSPVIWRGPLVMGLVRQFLKDVEWGELDVLVVDLPPGTGDAPLTLVQQVPLAGGVVVTTPQEVATLDVQRGIAMFEQVNTPVLGIVENMSYYECPHCGRRDDVFGEGGADRLAAAAGVPVLGRIPLVPEVRAGGDAGVPIVAAHPDHPVSRAFLDIARQVLTRIDAGRQAAAPPTIIG